MEYSVYQYFSRSFMCDTMGGSKIRHKILKSL